MIDGTATIEISDPGALPKQPLVSVYMLTYRHERFIAEAIEGVVAQKCDFPIELIIGEDCSPDNTRAIVLDYQRRYPQLIRVLTSEKNVGNHANTARCRSAIRGKYAAICEGDDCWDDPTKLARQIALMNAMPNVLLACHAANRVDAATGHVSSVQHVARKSRLLSTREAILGDGGLIPTCSILVRQMVFNNIPSWWAQAPVGDYPLVLRAAQLGRIAYQDCIMSSYRINVPGSWTTTIKEQSSIKQRYGHASAIKHMLLGYSKDMGKSYIESINSVIRKYIFYAIVRSTGDMDTKLSLLRKERATLTNLDYVLARCALATGRRFTRIHDLSSIFHFRYETYMANLTQPEC